MIPALKNASWRIAILAAGIGGLVGVVRHAHITGHAAGAVVQAGCGGEVEGPPAPAHVGHTQQAVSAQLAAWNSCYEEGDQEYDWIDPSIGSMCLEQWGSFPSNCGPAPNGSNATIYVPGKRCSDIGMQMNDDTNSSINGVLWPFTCRFGSFSSQNSYFSGQWVATTYTCSEAPSVSNVALAYDATTGNYNGSYTYSQSMGGPEGVSLYAWQFAPDGQNAKMVGVAQSLNVNAIDWSSVTSTGQATSGTLYFCVAPTLDTVTPDGTNMFGNDSEFVTTGSYTQMSDGSWTMDVGGFVCSSGTYVSSWSGPNTAATSLAVNPKVTLSNDIAVGSYTFNVDYSMQDYNSKYQWYLADDGTGTNRTAITKNSYGAQVGNTKSIDIDKSWSGRYLQFCVTPHGRKLDGSSNASSTEACSSYHAVRSLITLYQDTDEGGQSIAIPFQQASSGTCFDLVTMSFNDLLSSYTLHATQGHDTYFIFYANEGCTGTANTVEVAAASALTGNVGSSWNDSASSVRAVWSDTVAVQNPTLTLNPTSVQGNYTFYSSSNLPQTYTSMTIERASDANGTGDLTVASYAGDGTAHALKYNLQWEDDNMYLRFCASAQDQVTSSSTACSGWVFVGPVLTLYQNENYDQSGGTEVTFAYYNTGTVGECFDLTDYNFNDQMTSLRFEAPPSSVATSSSVNAKLWIYQNTGCGSSGGMSEEWDVGFGSSFSDANVGSTWNDQMSSFKVGGW